MQATWRDDFSLAWRRERAAVGEMDPAFEAMFRREYAHVLRWVGRFGVPAADADDVVQEVFLVAHRREGVDKGRGWLYQVARGVCANHQRSRVRAQARSRDLDWVPLPDQPAPQVEAIERKRRALSFAAFLDQLSPEQRECFELAVLDGLDGQAIAEATGDPRNTVYTRIRRAKAQFQEWLAARGGSEHD